MKRTVLLIIIGTCCGMTIGAYAAEISRAGIFSFSEIAGSVEGTDARDAHNRVVADDRAAAALASLFRDGLFDALVVRDAPTFVTAQSSLARLLNLADERLVPARGGCSETVAALACSYRRVMDGLSRVSSHASCTADDAACHAVSTASRVLVSPPVSFPLMRC